MPGKPRSEDLRVRAIEAVLEEGLSRREAARRFKIGDASVIRWVAAYEKEGRHGRLARRHRQGLETQGPSRLAVGAAAQGERPDAGGDGAKLMEPRHGVAADKSMLSRFFKAEGISFKKNRARQRAGAAGRGRGARRMATRAA